MKTAPYRVDVHHHLVPPEYVEAPGRRIVRRTPHPGGYGTASPDAGGAPGTFSVERARSASGVSSM